MKQFKTHIVRILFLALLFVSPILLTNFDDTKNFETAKHLDIFYSLFQELNTYYVDDIDPGELMSYGIDRMLEALDPYTRYIPESDVERFQMMTKGEYGGIGAMIGSRDSSMMISEIFEGFPAHKAGLLPGDKIISIDDRSIIGKDSDELHELLQGQPGTSIKLGIKRKGESGVKTFVIQRQTISMKSVPYYGMLENSVGYVKLTAFTQNCANEVKNACIDLKNKGAKSLILDLRENPGGLLMEAVQITNLFVEQGKKVVFTKGKNSISESVFYTKDIPFDTKIPLVVLVNENSASASEIVSGALQDLDRAVIVGKQTFGKGLVQTRRDLAHNSLLKITTSKYYIPSGRCIQKMDYSHHFLAARGIKEKVFYTLHKRPVKDAGGILPDVMVSTDSTSEFLKALFREYVLEDYVNANYSYKDTAHISSSNFRISEEEYKKFVQSANASGFEYISKSEELLKEVISQMKQERMSNSKQIQLLQAEINQHQSVLFETDKKQIKKELESLIIQRLYFEKGRIKHQTFEDEYLEQAKKYATNANLYSNIIEGMAGEHKK